MKPDKAITVLIPTSPIAAHPSTAIIEATIASVRHWLPDSRIWLMCDGVRSEQIGYSVRYSKYVRMLKAKRDFEPSWKNVLVTEFKEHRHQVGMTREVLEMVTTPLLMFLEHDCPIVTDRPIDWQGIVDVLLSGDAECIRLHYESRITPFHLYLFEEQFESHGVPLWKTRQFCARPHVATVEFYKRALAVFSENANSMIEDRLITFVEHSPWEAWKVCVYIPGDNFHRSLHLDGRKDDPKFELEMKF